VETEFAAIDGKLWLLQARPQSVYRLPEPDKKPEDVQDERVMLKAQTRVPQGMIHLEHVIYVDADRYMLLNSEERTAEAQEIGRLNEKYDDFIIVAPGRLGSSDNWLGVPVLYDNINCASAIIEYKGRRLNADFSYGSHFNMRLVSDNTPYIAMGENAMICADELRQRKVEEHFGGALIVSRLPSTLYLFKKQKLAVLEKQG
jgi:hypothetical protein